jgi:large subunit ribosomal protein L23
MALFSRNKNSDKASQDTSVTNKKTVKATAPALSVDTTNSDVIKGARLSEKSVRLSEGNVYTFNVRTDANKYQVRDAIKTIYNVTPTKINMVKQLPAKRIKGLSGKTVHVAGSKKAYVTLKKGDTIELV